MKRLCGLLCVAACVGMFSHWAYMAVALPEERPRVSCEISWLSRELGLNAEQRREVAALHAKYEPLFDHLFRRLKASHDAADNPVAEGVGEGTGLGICLAELTKICGRETESLVCQVGQVLNDEQRAAYFALATHAYALENRDLPEVYAQRQSCRKPKP